MARQKNPKPKSVRVDQQLWERFGEACEDNYTNRTEKINEFIQSYVHKWEMSTGHLTAETKDALESEIQKLVRKQSIQLLQQIMGSLGQNASSAEELKQATGQSPEDLKDFL